MRHHLFIFILALSLALPACATKVTDPSDPDFKVSQFRFEDYVGQNMTEVMLEIFPKGTDKEYVFDLFVGQMGLRPEKRPVFSKIDARTKDKTAIHSGETYFFYYANPELGLFGVSWKIKIHFDDQGKVTDIAAWQSAMEPL